MDRTPPPDTFARSGQTSTGWLSRGGVSSHGVRYGPPARAKTWGTQGCPLVPRVARELLNEHKLPSEFNLVFGETLTVGGLDQDVLARHNIPELPDQARRSLRDFLYDLESHQEWVAVPAGVPLLWIESLPLSGRTRNALRRTFRDHRVATYFGEPLMAIEFLLQRNVGIMALNELMCVIESAETGSTANEKSDGDVSGLDRDVDDISARIFWFEDEDASHDPNPLRIFDPWAEETLEHGAEILTGSDQATISPLINFAKWAMAETGATNLGEAIASVIHKSPEPDAWSELAAIPLTDLASPFPHPYEALRSWAEQLEPRESTVFTTRIAALRRSRTLEEIAHEFGVTRERIRQVEVRVRKRLQRFLESSSALPIVWRANSVRAKLGVAAPETVADELLATSEETEDFRAIILDLAGPYRREDDGWLIDRSAQDRNPTPSILANVDEVGRVDEQLAHLELSEWGLGDSLHKAWLLRCPGICEFNGRLVKWGSAIPDRLAFALADLGHPATIDDLMEHVAETRSKNSAINALGGDPRLIRVSPTEWALASWGSPEYTGTAHSIRFLLEEDGGSSTIDQIVLKMDQMFGVSENTTRSYCNAPMFIVDGEWLRLRTPADEPYQCDADSIHKPPGVFDLGHGRLGRMTEVDENTLRGSGAWLTEAAGAVLGVKTNDRLVFRYKGDVTVLVTFPETANNGPSLGSVKSVADELNAKVGDCLTLVLDTSDMSVAAELTDPSLSSRDWETIGRMTGIGTPMDSGALARALHCSDSEVRNILRQRGDDQILECLPHAQPSSNLDEALAALEAQVERP
jgi:hypothetical protein